MSTPSASQFSPAPQSKSTGRDTTNPGGVHMRPPPLPDHQRGIWGCPSVYSDTPLYYADPQDQSKVKYTDSSAYRNGNIAWGSASSATSERRMSHAMTEPEMANVRASFSAAQEQIHHDSHRRASLGSSSGLLSGVMAPGAFVSGMQPLSQSGTRIPFGGQNISILDQFGGLADATRQVELRRTPRIPKTPESTPPRASPHLNSVWGTQNVPESALDSRESNFSPGSLGKTRLSNWRSSQSALVEVDDTTAELNDLRVSSQQNFSNGHSVVGAAIKPMSPQGQPIQGQPIQGQPIQAGQIQTQIQTGQIQTQIQTGQPLLRPQQPMAPSSQGGFPGYHSGPIPEDRNKPMSPIPAPRKKDWKRTKRVENPLLETLRQPNHRLKLEDILDRTIEVAMDQHGSRFIQERLVHATPEVRQKLFEETKPARLQLVTDVFGNYVIQQLFQLGTPQQQEEMVRQMKDRILSLSLHMYGCRVVQMAIRYSSEPLQILIVGELRNHVVRCIKDHNGNHVIQKALEYIKPCHVQFIYESLMGRTFELARHTYGCRVVQRILEHADPATKQALLAQLRPNIDQLTEDQYGNYVVQHIVDNGPAQDRDYVFERLLDRTIVLSSHKYASNVVEKCFMRGTSAQRSAIISKILATDATGTAAVVGMVKDQYANYAVQKILDAASAEDHAKLVAAIKPHINGLKRSSYGKHLASIERLLG